MRIEVLGYPFDPWEEMRRYQTSTAAGSSAFGACASFIGTLRDSNEGNNVHAMRLEHYPGMTEKHLNAIAEEAAKRWSILHLIMLHRVGELQPGDPIVLTAVWSTHRAAAFAACQYLVEELKSRVPFWKKETLAQGERWVDHNTPGQ